MSFSTKSLFATIFIAVLSVNHPVWAGDQGADVKAQARVRFVGNGQLEITAYKDKICYGDSDNMDVFDDVRGSSFGSLFKKAKKLSIGMPVTPNVTHLQDRDLILSKAYYSEYAVDADRPLTMEVKASHNSSDVAGRPTVESCQLAVYFIPEKGKDYEVSVDFRGDYCRVHVEKIVAQGELLTLVPVKPKMANKCSAMDSGEPDLSAEEQQLEDARAIPDGLKIEHAIANAYAEINQQVNALLAKRRAERGLLPGFSAQCQDCPQMVESPDGRQSLEGTYRLPQLDDALANSWVRQIEFELGRYVANQRNYFNLPSNVVALPCTGADEDLRKAAEFVDFSELTLAQQQKFEGEHRSSGKSTYYFRDILLWPVQASCANGKLSGETEAWVFANEVYETPTSFSVTPRLRHVRYTAVDGRPIGLMSMAERWEAPNLKSYKDSASPVARNLTSQAKSEMMAFTYKKMDQSDNPYSVRVTNTINGVSRFGMFSEGPQTKLYIPLDSDRTETIVFNGVRKSVDYIEKNGVMHGKVFFYPKPEIVRKSPNVLGTFFAKVFPGDAKEKKVLMEVQCFKDGVKIDLDPCVVD